VFFLICSALRWLCCGLFALNIGRVSTSVKRSEAEVYNPPASSTPFMKKWICSSTPPTFLWGVERKNFAFFLPFTRGAFVIKSSRKMGWIECVARVWDVWEICWKFGSKIMVTSLSLGCNIRMKKSWYIRATSGDCLRGHVSKCC